MSELSPSVRPLARAELARVLDHTLRRADATAREIEKLCDEARTHGFFSVCVNGSRVARAAARLDGTPVKVTCAVGLGASETDVKRFEVEAALDSGAQILEVAANVGLVKDGDDAGLLREFRDVIEAADERPVSIGFDPRWVSEEEAIRLCRLAVEAGAKGVTLAGPADVAAGVRWTRRVAEVVGDNFGIKVDGLSLERADIVALLDAGATRFGLEDGVRLLTSL